MKQKRTHYISIWLDAGNVKTHKSGALVVDEKSRDQQESWHKTWIEFERRGKRREMNGKEQESRKTTHTEKERKQEKEIEILLSDCFRSWLWCAHVYWVMYMASTRKNQLRCARQICVYAASCLLCLFAIILQKLFISLVLWRSTDDGVYEYLYSSSLFHFDSVSFFAGT